MKASSTKLTLLAVFMSCCLAAIATGAALAQGDRPAQNQEQTPAGKRKALHEYSPEDILPEARENQRAKPVKSPAQLTTADNKTPQAAKPAATPKPVTARTLKPKGVVVALPTESAAPVAAVTSPTSQQTNNPTALRRKLLISSALFLLLLLALVFFVAKLLRQLRGGRETEKAATAPPLEEPHAAVGGRQLRADG